MARKRPEGAPSSYQERPTVPPGIAERFELATAVLARQLTMSEAARRLGISRPNMQTIVHRVQAAMLEALTPRPTGPKPRPPVEQALEAEVAKLRAKNAKLESQLMAADEMMGAAGEIIRSLRGLPPMKSPRSSAGAPRATKPSSSSDEDPEPPTPTSRLADPIARFVAKVATMIEPAVQAARLLGVGVATLRRWLGRVLLGAPLQRRRGGRRARVSPEAEHAVRDCVRALGPMVGAASLAHSIAGVSRRSAAILKRDELTRVERERKEAAAHVCVTRAGVVRGFDAMHLGAPYGLIAADAAVPYRTSAKLVDAYDASHVADTLDEDFSVHGPPLVLRYDRARCHDAESVIAVLEHHRVLPLHGPPHHPQYYGQLERQNREHRDWLAHHQSLDLDRMRSALNELWARPTLGWSTAAAAWSRRAPLDDDRDLLHEEVHQRAARLRADGVQDDMAMRLAIERALIKRGYLTITPGRRVLCE